MSLEEDDRHERGRKIIFIVQGSAPIDVATLTVSRERWMGPFLGVDIHGVGVANDQDRLLLSTTLQARDDIGAFDFRVRQIVSGEDF